MREEQYVSYYPHLTEDTSNYFGVSSNIRFNSKDERISNFKDDDLSGIDIKSKTPIKFGTDGWRAIMNDEFTFDNVGILVEAIADHLFEQGMDDKGVVVGYDPRFMSEDFAALACEILSTKGIRVYVASRDVPTPVVACAVKEMNASGAIMFTASHNPTEYNGMKWIAHYGGPASPSITDQIEKCLYTRIHERQFDFRNVKYTPVFMKKSKIAKSCTFDPYKLYIEKLEKLVNYKAIKNADLTLVYDPMHGAGRGYLDRILCETGLNVTTIRGERDPLFGGLSPDPIDDKLVILKETVVEKKADLGLATDGDADRFGVVDATGAYVSPNKVIPLIFAHLIERRKDLILNLLPQKNGSKVRIVRSVATTHMVDAIAAKHGIDVVETPVGFKYICAEMHKKNDVILGAEESGGLSIAGHVPEKDGILADLLVTEILAMTKKSLFENLAALEEEYGTYISKRVDHHMDSMSESNLAMEKLANINEVNGLKVVEKRKADGIKMIFNDDSWLLIRKSGTEPVLRVYAESKSEKTLDGIINHVGRIAGF